MAIRIPDRRSILRCLWNHPILFLAEFTSHIPRIQPRREIDHGGQNEEKSDGYRTA